MKEGEVIYIMYNGINSGVPNTLLFSGKEHGRQNGSAETILKQHYQNTLNCGLIKNNLLLQVF